MFIKFSQTLRFETFSISLFKNPHNACKDAAKQNYTPVGIAVYFKLELEIICNKVHKSQIRCGESDSQDAND